ncbi:phospholipase D family protein [Actinomadura macra]|uniref:phospholipase D family protein n=1 Tax=Actinomadura macra TaxID=46164 RepID=UPI00083428F7|nr:phospholipase D family protein [Actinomadura macra]
MSEMPDALIRKYLPLGTDHFDGTSKGERPPAEPFKGNHVEALVDAVAYFGALDDEIAALKAGRGPGRYFYLSAWWLGLVGHTGAVAVESFGAKAGEIAKRFGVQPRWSLTVEAEQFVLPKSGRALLYELCELAMKGVDVRVLAWTSPFLPKYKPVADKVPGVAALNLHTILSVDALRSAPAMRDAVMLNMLAHPMGAAHLKTVVCGDQTSMRAYTGGLDPHMSRFASVDEPGGWHDVAARVQGPAAAAIHDFFRQLWNEQRRRPTQTFRVAGKEIPSQTKGVKEIPAREPTPAPAGAEHLVQVLRTVPRMNFSSSGPTHFPGGALQRWLVTNLSGFRTPALSFAPDGVFEFKAALEKAISSAERYIFIADQAFQSQEVMDWINTRKAARPDLKIILVYGPDPADTPTGLFHQAINKHLLRGPDQPTGIAIHQWAEVTAHCKVTIVDDRWCAIGSANCMRRSLYTDIELSIGVLDTGNASFVRTLRRDLWARYCGLSLHAETQPARTHGAELDALQDLDKALGVWDPDWGTPPEGISLRPTLQRLPLPVPETIPYTEEVRDLADPDSRERL